METYPLATIDTQFGKLTLRSLGANQIHVRSINGEEGDDFTINRVPVSVSSVYELRDGIWDLRRYSEKDSRPNWQELYLRRVHAFNGTKYDDSVSSSIRRKGEAAIVAAIESVLEANPDFLSEGGQAKLLEDLSRAQAAQETAWQAYLAAVKAVEELRAQLPENTTHQAA